MMMGVFLLSLTAFLPAAEAKILTWQECVQAVAQRNPNLHASEENALSTDDLVGSSRSGFFPSLTGTVNSNHQFSNPSAPQINYQSGVNTSSALTLNYNLFSGFRDLATVNKAKGNLVVAHASLDGVRASVSDALRQAAIRLYYAQSNVTLTASIRDRRAQNERMIRAQYENGRENQGSYLLSQSKLESSKFDFLVATHAEVIAREALAHAIGEYDSNLSLVGDLPRSDPPGEMNLKDLVQVTPTHRIQEGQVYVSQANVTLANAGFFPSLDFTAAVQNPNHVLYTNDNQYWSVGLGLTIPLFSGLSTFYSTKSAHALERAANETEFYTDLTTYETLRRALYSFQESVQKLKVDALTLNALSAQERIATKQYNNGLMKFENWDIIEGNFIDAQKIALASARDRDIAESAWRLAQGLGDLP